MNIIFLDMDGVLCTPRACVAMNQTGVYSYLDPIACHLVIRLIEEFNATIVVSSTWRKEGKELFVEMLKCAGWHAITNALHKDEWCTPDHSHIKGGKRGDEIDYWLSKHDYNKYIILDDESDFSPKQIKNHLVKCDLYNGMGLSEYERARVLLG